MTNIVVIDIDELRKIIMETVKVAITTYAPSNSTENKEILSVKEASKFLDMQPKTIYNKVSSGEITPIRKGKRIYFERSYLNEWLRGEDSSQVAKNDVNNFLAKFKN